MWARNTMLNADATKIGIEAVILTTPIRLHSTNLSVKETLNMSLKDVEDVFNI
jgi:hypothetical protein